MQTNPANREGLIRTTLQGVRGSTEVSQAGADYAGLSPEAPLVIRSFYDRECGRAFQQRLLDAGIMSTKGRSRGRMEVIVALSDRRRAEEVLSEHLAAYPDVRRFSHRRPLDYTLLSAGMAFVFAMIFMVGNDRLPLSHRLQLAGLVVTLGILVGGMLDLSLGRYYRKGSLQFGIGSLLLLTAAIALILFLGRLIFELGV